MTKIFVMSLGLMLASGVFAQTPQYVNGIRQGRVLVKLKNTPTVVRQMQSNRRRINSRGEVQASFDGFPELKNLASQVKTTSIIPVFQATPQFEERFNREGLNLWYYIDYDSNASPLALSQEFLKIADVEKCEPEIKRVEPQYALSTPVVTPVNPSTKAITADATVNDPLYSKQWHYHNYGQTGGLVGADINLEKAWKKRMSAKNVIVAVMDNGFDYNHEDLRENIWVNEAEYAGTPGVDDDGDGYIDDIYGFDFGNGTGTIGVEVHGTHVCGTIAAVNNNKTGVAGIAGGDGMGNGAKLMLFPVFGANQTRAANCYIYAADHGALVSQNSWGYSTPGIRSEAFEEAIQYFVKYAGCDNNGNQLPGSLMKGGLVIFAAGNNGESGEYYPACLDYVVGVASVNQINEPAGYTVYDTWVDVACYGGETSVLEQGVLSTIPSNQYAYMQGTSMACPHVSGIAALSLAELGGPGFTQDMLRNYIVLTARNNESSYSNAYKGKMGSGIADALLAMTKNDGEPPVAIADATVTMIGDKYATLTFTAPAKNSGAKVEGYRIVLTPTTGNAITLVKSSAKEPGFVESFVLTELTSNQNYKVEVYSFDLWGVNSKTSNELSFKTATVKGTLAYTKPFPVTLKTTDYNKEQYWDFDIVLTNNAKEEGAGALKWRADGYNYAHQNRLFTNVNTSAAPQTREALPNTLVSEPFMMVPYGAQVGNGESYSNFYDWISYRPSLYADTFIGDQKGEGVFYESAAAQKFVVPATAKEGFCLTAFDLAVATSKYWYYDGEIQVPTGLKMKFEVYRGGDSPLADNLIYSGELTDIQSLLIRLVKLPYAPYFEPGESFWIVVKPDKRYKYPFGINENGDKPEYSLYSSDGGTTWSQLSNVYNKVANPCFTISALSHANYGRPYMTLTPASGYLEKGQTQTVKARIALKDIPEGVDTSFIYFNTDGNQLATYKKITAILNLSRTDFNVNFNRKSYEYGLVSIGDESIMRIGIKNTGLAHYPIEQLTLSNDKDFSVSTALNKSIVYSNDSVYLSVKFKPTSLGAKNTQLTIQGRNFSKSVYLVGTCVESPQAVIPTDPIICQVTGNENKQIQLSVRNNSNYSLQYVLPELLAKEQAKHTATYQEVSSELRTDTMDIYTGYSWKDNHMNNGYAGTPWMDISKTGTEITRYCDDVEKLVKVKLPFSFRYYDRTLNEVYVSLNGFLRCDYSSFTYNVPVELPYSSSDDQELENAMHGMIAPLWVMDGTSGNYNATHLYYQVMEDCIIFQFSGTKMWMMDGGDGSTDCQVALYPNGSFELRYNKIFGDGHWLANAYSVGWASPDGTDGKTLFFRGKQFSKEGAKGYYCIRVTPAAYNPFGAVAGMEYEGVVGPQETKLIAVNVDPTELQGGETMKSIEIQTNDPDFKSVQVPVQIQKEDYMSVRFLEDTIRLDAHNYAISPITQKVALFNGSTLDGNVVLKLSEQSAVRFQDGTLRQLLAVKNSQIRWADLQVAQGGSASLYVLNESESAVYDTVYITAPSSDYYTITQDLINKQSLAYDFKAGESQQETLHIQAADHAYKSYMYVPGFMESAQPTDLNQESAQRFSYRWFSSADADAPQFIWTDISKTGERINLRSDVEYNGQELPFSFPFYGKEYNKIYVSPNGRISPLPIGWDVMYDYVAPRRMPNADIALPLISAMWARQWYQEDDEEAGVFIQYATDKVIIQYHHFMYDWVNTNGYCSYQVIIYKNGTIQFVYDNPEDSDLGKYITIGMQGVANSSEVGYTYSLNSSASIKNKTTITAKPIYGPYVIQPGHSRDINLLASSYGFKAGEYHDELVFESENGLQQTVIPVSMKVSSNASLQIQETAIDFDKVIVGDSIAPKTINVANMGNQDLTIQSIDFAGTDADKFSIFRYVTELDSENKLIKVYKKIELPFTLTAYGNETFYVFFTPEAETRHCEATLTVTSSANASSVVLKAYAVKPSTLQIRTVDGKDEMSLDLNGSTQDVKGDFQVNYLEGVDPVNLDMTLQVYNEPIQTAQELGSAKSAAHQLGSASLSKPTLLSCTPLATPYAVATPSTANAVMQPLGAAISVIGSNSLSALVGTGNMGIYYALSVYVKMDTQDHGFLLSHLRAAINTMGRDTGEVVIRIYSDCPQPDRAHLLYEKLHKLKLTTTSIEEVTFPLEHHLAFAPHQEFWVEMYFPVGLTQPIAVASTPSGMTEVRNYCNIYNARTDTWEGFQSYDALFGIWCVQETNSDLTTFFKASLNGQNLAPLSQTTGEYEVNPLELPVGALQLDLGAKTDILSEVSPLRLQIKKYTEPVWTRLPKEAMIMKEGESISFVVKAEDPDGDKVRYRLTQAVTGVTTKVLEDGALQVDFAAPYTSSALTEIAIEARTNKGVSIRRIPVSVINVNHAPVALEVKPITLSLRSMNPLVLPVSYFFVDPDGDAMSFRVTTTTEGVTATLENRGIVITPSYEDIVDLIIVASDDELETMNKVRITVVQPLNTPPVLMYNFTNTAIVSGSSASFDLNNYFYDPEGEEITYTVWATNPDVASVVETDGVMTVTAKETGYSAIAIKAVDASHCETLVSFTVRSDAASGSSYDKENIVFLVNTDQEKKQVRIAYKDVTESALTTLDCQVYDMSGHQISNLTLQGSPDSNLYEGLLDIADYRQGVYLLSVRANGVVKTSKFIVE